MSISLLDLPNASDVADEFHSSGYTVLRQAMAPALHTDLLHDVDQRIHMGSRKDFLMAQSGMSPRHMRVLGGSVMSRSLARDLYEDQALIAWLSRVAGARICCCPNSSEDLIATILERPGDTHGWHLDDYPIAMILVLEQPVAPGSAKLEVRSDEGVSEITLASADIYLMRSDVLLHRVSPLEDSHRRVILNFTYAFEGATVAENGSAELLCT